MASNLLQIISLVLNYLSLDLSLALAVHTGRQQPAGQRHSSLLIVLHAIECELSSKSLT